MRLIVFAAFIVFGFQNESFAGLKEARDFLGSVNNFDRTEKPETVTVHGLTFPYDPLVVTAVSSLESRLPDGRADDWIDIELRPPGEAAFCRGKIKAYVRKTHSLSPYTFIILPDSYSTFHRRSFVNKTAGILSSKFKDPTLIAFDGFISPEFLKGRCSQIPWDINRLGTDLYLRLRSLLRRVDAESEYTGIIGYSGGASLAMAILAADSNAAEKDGEERIALGGLISSPLLHPRTAFENLDAARRNVTKNRDVAFTTSDLGNLLFLLKNGGQPTWQQMPQLASEGPADFRRRYFNELVIVDLKDMLIALGRTPPANDKLSYFDTFIGDGYAHDRPHLRYQELAREFDTESDIRKTVSRIKQPLLIHSAKDDPNHSDHDGHDQPAAVQAVVDFATAKSNVIMLNPTFAGHVSILLEPNYPNLVYEFFRPSLR